MIVTGKGRFMALELCRGLQAEPSEGYGMQRARLHSTAAQLLFVKNPETGYWGRVRRPT